MDTLVIEGVPIPGVPESVRLAVGDRRAIVVADPGQARTLADLVTGLIEPPPGTVIHSSGPVRLVPAEGGLLPHLTVLENLIHGTCATSNLARHTAAETGRATAAGCGLADLVDRYPYQLTPGGRRLGGVARALCAGARSIVLEDADGLPTWGALLAGYDLELGRVVSLLIAPTEERIVGFGGADGA